MGVCNVSAIIGIIKHKPPGITSGDTSLTLYFKYGNKARGRMGCGGVGGKSPLSTTLTLHVIHATVEARQLTGGNESRVSISYASLELSEVST